MTCPVDIVVLSRDDRPLLPEVRRGLEAQRGVPLYVHRVVGAARPTDLNRWQTIARQRNIGKRRGASPWFMFLDDDVELEPQAIPRLIAGLSAAPDYAALAADYRKDRLPGPAFHVPMGATLFRRSVLGLIEFRWEPGRCECQCCCDDLRRQGWGIDFLPGVFAHHWRGKVARTRSPRRPADSTATADKATDLPGKRRGIRPWVLAAFNRRHLPKFRRQFLTSLRRSGNFGPVGVIGYGLYASEQAGLRRLPGVELLALPASEEAPPIRRLRDFQTLLTRLDSETPVAYWDAADVFFQDSLARLWCLVRENPGRLLAVREPCGYPENDAARHWTKTIADRDSRENAIRLLKGAPFLNSGFAAGTARTLLEYTSEADRLRHSKELRGTSDWGDQMALNLYCHSDPGVWREIEAGWNYCVYGRDRGEVRVRSDGRVVGEGGSPIHVVHGNAHSFRNFELSSL